MDNSFKISSTDFEDKTKIELAKRQLYSFYFKNNTTIKGNGHRIRTHKPTHNLLFFRIIKLFNKELQLKKFENTIPYRYVNGIRTFLNNSQIIIFQIVMRKIQFKSCTKRFNDNPSKFTKNLIISMVRFFVLYSFHVLLLYSLFRVFR
ncbi:Uncharacterised protein [Chryseobacterium indologenes]|nr:Uncharacterised protein [Chryseobacterium indologenes]